MSHRRISEEYASSAWRFPAVPAQSEYVLHLGHSGYDKIAPFFTTNYAPKSLTIENNRFRTWARKLAVHSERVVEDWNGRDLPGKLRRLTTVQKQNETGSRLEDSVIPEADAVLRFIIRTSDRLRIRHVDLVITDPPFGDNIFYSDLANFFHAWLRFPLRHEYPELFEPTKTPNAKRPWPLGFSPKTRQTSIPGAPHGVLD